MIRELVAMLCLAILPVWADDIALLNLRVAEGEGTTYATGGRATRGITLKVTDEQGRPVAGATVGFHLPDSGATGVFSNGARDEITTTDAEGKAVVWGMRWGKTPGTVQVRITAVKGSVRAGTISTQYVVEHLATAAGPSGRRTRKMIWVAAAIAGAAGAGLALGSAKGSAQAPAAATIPPPTIGMPTITVGNK